MKLFQLLLVFLNIAVGCFCVCHYKCLTRNPIEPDSLVGIDVGEMTRRYGAPIEIFTEECIGGDKCAPIVHCTYELGVKDGYLHFVAVDISSGKVSFAAEGSRRVNSR